MRAFRVRAVDRVESMVSSTVASSATPASMSDSDTEA